MKRSARLHGLHIRTAMNMVYMVMDGPAIVCSGQFAAEHLTHQTLVSLAPQSADHETYAALDPYFTLLLWPGSGGRK